MCFQIMEKCHDNIQNTNSEGVLIKLDSHVKIGHGVI